LVPPEEAGAGATAAAAAEPPSKELISVPFKKAYSQNLFCHKLLNSNEK